MNPLGDRARAEELARLLEGAVAGPTAQTAGFASLATRLRAVAPALEDRLAPRAEFRAALRQRLVAVATVQGGQAGQVAAPAPVTLPDPLAWTRSWKAQRRIALVSGAMATVVGLTGVAVASSRSLPGQPFYGMKRTAEDVQLRFAGSDTERGTMHLEFASTRLREVRALVAGESQLSAGVPGQPLAGSVALGGSLEERVRATLEDFAEETGKGRDLLKKEYRRTGKPAPLRILTTFSTQQEARLTSLIPELPAGTASAAQESLELVEEVRAEATQLLEMGTCSTDCDPSTGGPTLPEAPQPTPGTSATAEPGDNNGVPDCACTGPEPTPAPSPSPAPSAEPSGEPTPSPSPSPSESPEPTSTPTPSPSSSPFLPLPLPLPVPTILPTGVPTGLPEPLASILPTLAPDAVLRP